MEAAQQMDSSNSAVTGQWRKLEPIHTTDFKAPELSPSCTGEQGRVPDRKTEESCLTAVGAPRPRSRCSVPTSASLEVYSLKRVTQALGMRELGTKLKSGQCNNRMTKRTPAYQMPSADTSIACPKPVSECQLLDFPYRPEMGRLLRKL